MKINIIELPPSKPKALIPTPSNGSRVYLRNKTNGNGLTVVAASREKKNLISWYESLRQEENWMHLKKDLDDEQTNIFKTWMNNIFNSYIEFKQHPIVTKQFYSTLIVTNLYTDLMDGLRILYLLEMVYETHLPKEFGFCKLKKSVHESYSKLHKIKNFEICIQFLEHERKIRCYGINPIDLVEGNKKIMLGLLFLIKNNYETSLTRKNLANETRFIVSKIPSLPAKFLRKNLTKSDKMLRLEKKLSTYSNYDEVTISRNQKNAPKRITLDVIEQFSKSYTGSANDFLTFSNSHGYYLADKFLKSFEVDAKISKEKHESLDLNKLKEKISSKSLTKDCSVYGVVNAIVHANTKLDELYIKHVKSVSNISSSSQDRLDENVNDVNHNRNDASDNYCNKSDEISSLTSNEDLFDENGELNCSINNIDFDLKGEVNVESQIIEKENLNSALSINDDMRESVELNQQNEIFCNEEEDKLEKSQVKEEVGLDNKSIELEAESKFVNEIILNQGKVEEIIEEDFQTSDFIDVETVEKENLKIDDRSEEESAFENIEIAQTIVIESKNAPQIDASMKEEKTEEIVEEQQVKEFDLEMVSEEQATIKVMSEMQTLNNIQTTETEMKEHVNNIERENLYNLEENKKEELNNEHEIKNISNNNVENIQTELNDFKNAVSIQISQNNIQIIEDSNDNILSKFELKDEEKTSQPTEDVLKIEENKNKAFESDIGSFDMIVNEDKNKINQENAPSDNILIKTENLNELNDYKNALQSFNSIQKSENEVKIIEKTYCELKEESVERNEDASLVVNNLDIKVEINNYSNGNIENSALKEITKNFNHKVEYENDLVLLKTSIDSGHLDNKTIKKEDEEKAEQKNESSLPIPSLKEDDQIASHHPLIIENNNSTDETRHLKTQIEKRIQSDSVVSNKNDNEINGVGIEKHIVKTNYELDQMVHEVSKIERKKEKQIDIPDIQNDPVEKVFISKGNLNLAKAEDKLIVHNFEQELSENNGILASQFMISKNPIIQVNLEGLNNKNPSNKAKISNNVTTLNKEKRENDDEVKYLGKQAGLVKDEKEAIRTKKTNNSKILTVNHKNTNNDNNNNISNNPISNQNKEENKIVESSSQSIKLSSSISALDHKQKSKEVDLKSDNKNSNIKISSKKIDSCVTQKPNLNEKKIKEDTTNCFKENINQSLLNNKKENLTANNLIKTDVKVGNVFKDQTSKLNNVSTQTNQKTTANTKNDINDVNDKLLVDCSTSTSAIPFNAPHLASSSKMNKNDFSSTGNKEQICFKKNRFVNKSELISVEKPTLIDRNKPLDKKRIDKTSNSKLAAQNDFINNKSNLKKTTKTKCKFITTVIISFGLFVTIAFTFFIWSLDTNNLNTIDFFNFLNKHFSIN